MVRKFIFFAAVFAAVLGAGVPAASQVITNPTASEWESPDHNAVLADGTTPVIFRYDVCWRYVGASTCFMTSDMGKPAQVGTQNGNPLIRTDIATIIRPLPTTNVFEAIVKAVGPGGSSAWSLPSNSFQLGAVPSTPSRATVR